MNDGFEKHCTLSVNLVLQQCSIVIYSNPIYTSFNSDSLHISCFAISPTGDSSSTQCDTVSWGRMRGVVLIALLMEVLTSPSWGVLSDRGRRTCLEWRSQWKAHRSKTGKCQTPSTRQSFLYATLTSAKATPHRPVLWIRMHDLSLVWLNMKSMRVSDICHLLHIQLICNYYDAFKKYFTCYYIISWTLKFQAIYDFIWLAAYWSPEQRMESDISVTRNL